uniref:Mating type protein n=2 Tax=Leptographium longiclavatum TaxID=300481 RepID=M4PKX6_9PEZI|nr:mating type protein [Leptographium longiclavatum]AGH03205.1 mating type protein [Leptographium longiclavatum]AGH03209.1 mating type protein [Leptographium longiclavatum]
MADIYQRRVSFVVDDDSNNFSVSIPEELITISQLRAVACGVFHMADDDCCILYDAQAKTYRLVPVSDSKFVDLKRFRVMGYARASDDGTTPAPEPRIPRPPNAWIIYRSHKSKEIRKKVPHVTAGYISTLVSQMWKQESCAIRLLYNDKAIEAQKVHKAMYPNYKYNSNAKKTQ